jgi:hypothetical protein
MTRAMSLLLALCLAAVPAAALDFGTAAGKGTIERLIPAKSAGAGSNTEQVSFSPRYSYAYSEGSGAARSTWIVLTEKEPPVKAWAVARDRAEARRSWCGSEKTPFVAVKLDSKWAVDLYFLCPADGNVNTEMLSSWNGLDSVIVKLEQQDAKRLKGTLRTGQGSCPGPNGTQAYCKPTGDFTFEAPLSR